MQSVTETAATGPSPAGQSAAGSAFYLGAAQAIRLITTVLSTIIVARLLSPEDYGIYAMAGPLIGFIVLFQDFGLSAAAIQARQLEQRQSSALFWMNMTASAAIAVALVAIAPLVSWFYGDVRPAYLTAASGVAVLVAGLGLQHSALLSRGMQFRVLSQIEITNVVVTFVGTVVAAWWLRSYWALFLGSLTGSVIQITLLWSRSNFRPSTKPSLRAARSFARFGSHLTGVGLLDFIVRNADNVLLARFAGPTVLGLYDRSYKLMMLPIQNINAPVARLLLPVLSRQYDDPARYRLTFLTAARGVMLASAPGIAVSVAISDRLMIFMLGPEWAAAGPIFFWLGLTGLVQPVANLTGLLYTSSGRTGTMLWWGVVSAVITLAAFVLGLPWGPRGIAMALFFSALARLPIIFILAAERRSALRPRDLWAAQVQPLLGAAAIALLAATLDAGLHIVLTIALFLPLAYGAAFLTSCLGREGRLQTLSLLSGAIVAIGGTVRRRRAAKLNASAARR